MTSPALAQVPVLIDDRPGPSAVTRTLDAELLDRATRDDYRQWLSTALAAGGCVRPIRLRGTARDIDPATGEVVRGLDTEDLPDKAIYIPCGDRRASVCPPCAETYRADTYQLIRAGLAGGKGVPESVATHPCVFATFTAPSFGPVHTRVTTDGGWVARCRPRRKANYCPHGRRLSCGQRHRETDACLGRPLCPDCYDYQAAVVWNAHASELWRRTVIGLRRQLDKLAKAHGTRVKLSYAKVGEFQRRGLIHFHAIFRLDGLDPVHPERTVPPRLAFTADVLADAIRQAASVTCFATVSHPARPKGWDITWGAQVDPRVVRLTEDGEITDVAVASYLAKYATKSTEAVGLLAVRITAGNLRLYGNPASHQGRLIRAAWQLGNHPHSDFQALRRWAHMLGYRGHFATKSHRYSTTMRAPRASPPRLAPPPAPPPRASRRRRDRHNHHRPRMGRARLAHHRRRRPRVVGHRKSPRVSPHRPQRSIRRLIKKGDLIAMSDADMGSSDDRLLKCEEVAAILGSGPRFPYRLIAERRIRFTRVGRHVRIPESALREFIEAGMVEPLSTLHRRRRKVA